MKNILVFILLFFSLEFISQTIVNCPSNLIYFHSVPIQIYDPSLPISASNPSTTTIPGGGTGLAVCDNLNGSPVSPTFYTIVGNIYHYWNGSSWISTGHTSGAAIAVNPAGAGCFIYNLAGATGDIYKYDGTGNGTFFMNVPGFSGSGPYDLSADLDGNFYILRTDTNQWMRMYDISGTLVNTYSVTGMPLVVMGGGFAVTGNTVYVRNTPGFYKGLISGSVVNFSLVSTTITNPGDFANCPSLTTGTLSYSVYNTGSIGCASATSTVIASGFVSGTTYSWSGPGLAGPVTNSSVPVTSAGLYKCEITPPGGCRSILSTSVTSSSVVNITVTPSSTLMCQGTSIIISASGAANYTWTPGTGLSSTSGNTVSANPITSTIYTITGTTGTCTSAPKIANINIANCTSINEYNAESYRLSIYPNPNNGEFVIRAKTNMDLYILNSLGEIVKEIKLIQENNFEVTIKDLYSGIYFITNSNGESFKNKIVVIKN